MFGIISYSIMNLLFSHVAYLNPFVAGTHDTGAYSLDVNGPIASDAPGIVRSISWIPGIKGVLCDWGLTQTLTFKQQLEAGIRYFDLRVALNPQDKKLYLVHTLYGPLVICSGCGVIGMKNIFLLL